MNHFLLSAAAWWALDRESRNRHDLKGPRVPALRIGIEVAALGVPLGRALSWAAERGADAVELDARGELAPNRFSQTGLRHLRKILDDLRLRVSAVTFRSRRGYDTPAELDRRVAATKSAMELAYRLGCSVVVNSVGRVPPEAGGPSWELLVEVLSDLSQHGLHVGAVLAAEAGAESGPQLARLLHALPEGGIGADLNPGNLLAGGHSPLEAIHALGPTVVHVHATDASCDPARNRGTQVPVGQGSADWPALLGALEEYDYHGYLTVSHQGTPDAAEGMIDVIRYLRGL